LVCYEFTRILVYPCKATLNSCSDISIFPVIKRSTTLFDVIRSYTALYVHKNIVVYLRSELQYVIRIAVHQLPDKFHVHQDRAYHCVWYRNFCSFQCNKLSELRYCYRRIKACWTLQFWITWQETRHKRHSYPHNLLSIFTCRKLATVFILHACVHATSWKTVTISTRKKVWNESPITRENYNTVTCIPIARQWVTKHIPTTTNTSIARQRRGKHAFTTIEEAAFSVWCAPRILTRDTFFLRGPCRVYITRGWRISIGNDRPVHSLERALHINKPATVWQ
jgi:hypothetical protein